MARGSTRASFWPVETLAIWEMDLSVSAVGAPVMATVETAKIEDQAKR